MKSGEMYVEEVGTEKNKSKELFVFHIAAGFSSSITVLQ